MATVHKVLNAWGPGKFDAELFLDGKAFQPNGRSAATLIPPAFGLAGVNLHTWTGWGSVPYWNAFVAVLEMHGQGNFFDPRLDNAKQFPIAAENHFGHVMVKHDLVTPEAARAARVRAVAQGAVAAEGIVRPRRPLPAARRCSTGRRSARPATCRRSSPSLARTCIREAKSASATSRQTARRRTCTAPVRWPGCGPTSKGGFYHDGRFPTLMAVVKHYNNTFHLGLTRAQEKDLVQYLLSL